MSLKNIIFYCSILSIFSISIMLNAMEERKRKREEPEKTREYREPDKESEPKKTKVEKVSSLKTTALSAFANKIMNAEKPIEIINELEKAPIKLREEIANLALYPGDPNIFKTDKDISIILKDELDHSHIENQNLLSYLISHKQLAAAERLFELIGSNLNVTSSDSLDYTPIMYACMSGSLSLIEKIIKTIREQGRSLDEEVNRQNLDTSTSLILASILCSEAIPLLIQRGKADVNKQFGAFERFSPIMILTEIKPFDATSFKLLLSYSPDLYIELGDDDAYDSAGFALSVNNFEALKLLIINGNYNVNHQGSAHTLNQTILMETAFSPKPEIIKFLISKGADVNLKNSAGETALSLALNNFKEFDAEIEKMYPKLIEIAQDLLDHGATIPKHEYDSFLNTLSSTRLGFELLFEDNLEQLAALKKLLDTLEEKGSLD